MMLSGLKSRKKFQSEFNNDGAAEETASVRCALLFIRIGKCLFSRQPISNASTNVFGIARSGELIRSVAV
jgi:hypothetical protein